MRTFVLLLASAGLFACAVADSEDRAAESSEGAKRIAAAISYDGADYGDDRTAMLAHGERLSHVLGCRGCHTGDLTGMPFPPVDEGFPQSGIWASNITRVIPDMTDAQLKALLTEGKHPTRDDMWMMPSAIFQHLSGADVDALMAHLRTVKPMGDASPLPAPTPAFLAMVEQGVQLPVSKQMGDHRESLPKNLGPRHALGRQIATTSCAECHGAELEGVPDFTPAIADVAPMYDDAAFTKLLTTGEGLEGRELGLMGLVGREHFGYLTSKERKAVVDYAQALGAANPER
ncbi:cytochrome c [Sphingomicrobium sp. XHP0239]